MTINFDHINGAFETVGGLICWLNFLRLRKDKEVKGIDWRVSAFFATWGWWNLFYYPSLAQWASFAGGCLLVLGNTAWVLQALKYRKLDLVRAPVGDCECDIYLENSKK